MQWQQGRITPLIFDSWKLGACCWQCQGRLEGVILGGVLEGCEVVQS